MDGWNTIVSFWDGLFLGAKMLVSGSVDHFIIIIIIIIFIISSYYCTSYYITIILSLFFINFVIIIHPAFGSFLQARPFRLERKLGGALRDGTGLCIKVKMLNFAPTRERSGPLTSALRKFVVLFPYPLSKRCLPENWEIGQKHEKDV